MYIRTRRWATWRKSEYGGDKYRNKVEEEFPAGTNVVKKIEDANEDVPKEESSSSCGKDRYEYEGSDKVTGNKEIDQANTEIAVYEGIAVWPQSFSGKLLVVLVT